MDSMIRSAASRVASIAAAAVLASGMVLAAGSAASAATTAPQVSTTKVVTKAPVRIIKVPVGTPGVVQPLNGSAWQD